MSLDNIYKQLENDIYEYKDDFDFKIGETISYIIKTLLVIANREKDIKIVVLTKRNKNYKKVVDFQTR